MSERGLLYVMILAVAIGVFILIATVEFYALTRQHQRVSHGQLKITFLHGIVGFFIFAVIPTIYVGSYADRLSSDTEQSGNDGSIIPTAPHSNKPETDAFTWAVVRNHPWHIHLRPGSTTFEEIVKVGYGGPLELRWCSAYCEHLGNINFVMILEKE